MRNKYLDEETSADIDGQVAKILRGLGNPEPPLDLTQVRELLRLDRAYYSSADDSALQEWVSKAKIAGKQLILRPTLILEAVRKWDLKALYVPDHRRILIDQEQPEPKWRWNEAHETIHAVIPWHQSLMHGDNLYTLSPSCHEDIEAEANYGAGRLLFIQERFEAFARDSSPTFDTVKSASKLFKNSMTSCLWRLIECLDIPAAGVVSQHPRYPDDNFNAAEPCRYFIRSRLFEGRFSSFGEPDIFEMIRSYCKWTKRGPLGGEELVLTDDRGEEHIFTFETFHNGHEALTLIIYVRKHVPVRR